MTKAKIIATIGPASSSTEIIRKLLKAGMDAARLNFSHGTHQEHKNVYNRIRLEAKKAKRPVAIIADLQGPKMRVGKFQNGGVKLKTGSSVFLTNKKCTGTSERVYFPYSHLMEDVREGDQILLDDGLIRLCAEKILKDKILCKIREGGLLKDHKAIHLPHISPALPILTAKDKRDLLFALSLPVDYIALSFVRTAHDVLTARKTINRFGAKCPIIAKLEHPQALQNLDEILDASDGVMVARGDLGIEVSITQVPLLQKKIVDAANHHKIPVIVATQMLESMVEHPIPTRAEASDVANAVIDGADAVMLSGETATGKFPVETVKVMDAIVREVEKHLYTDMTIKHIHETNRKHHPLLTFPDAVSFAASRACSEVHAKAIVVFTESGLTARMISKYKPSVPIYAFTPDTRTLNRLSLYYGVIPFHLQMIKSTDKLIEKMDKFLLDKRLVKSKDTLVVLLGAPVGVPGNTNLMKLHRVRGA